MSFFLPQFCGGNLDQSDVAVEPLNEGHDGQLVEGYGVVAGGSEDDPHPGGDVLALSLPP